MSEKNDWTSASSEQISKEVRSIILKNFNQQANQTEYLNNNSDELVKFSEMGFDSLDITEFNMALEDTFGVEIEEEDLKNLVTVRDVVEYIVLRKQTEASSAAVN